MRTLFDRIRNVSPQGALLIGLVVGLLLVLFSFLLGIATWTIESDGVLRQVGYAAAPNWSITFTLVFPLFAYFALGALRSTDRSFPALDRMLVDATGQRVDDAAASVARRYRKLLGTSNVLASVLAVLAIVGSLVEWFFFSARPLLMGSTVPEGEIDWSVAMMGKEGMKPALNALFSFFAFSVQGFYIAALAVFLVYVYVFSELVRQLADASSAPMLVPDVDSLDPRRGFQHFGRIAGEILFACGCAFLVFWISRLQNLYLQSKSASLWEYFRGDLGTSVIALDWSLFTRALADTGGIEFSSVMVILGALTLIAAVIAVPLHTLRRAATHACDTARDLANRRPRMLAAHKSDEALKASLDGMVVWPISYPQLNQLIFWLFFALVSLVFYRIGTAFLLLWTWRVVRRAFAAGEKQSSPAVSDG